jgi:hypothetical protein
MPRTSPIPRELAKFSALQEDFSAALSAATRALGPLLKREKTGGIATEAAIYSRTDRGAVAHVPVRLKSPIRVAELYRRPHVIGVLVAPNAIRERVTEVIVPPGAYAVKLRPVSCSEFAFDFIGADGRRTLAAPAQMKPGRTPEENARLSDFYGIDIEIDPPDDILNPFHTYLCLSFLFWRTCLDFPKRPVP